VIGSFLAIKVIRAGRLSILPKLLAGTVGGVAGGSLLATIFNGGAPAPVVGGSLDVAVLLVQAIGGLLGGGVLASVLAAILEGARR
jgi:hypothetical protein